jgi:thiazole/oxazole-forming peptide maturase SagD family component
MNITEVARRGANGIDPRIRRYMERCVSPLVGPIRLLRLINYDSSSPALVTVLPELVDLHRRAGVPKPQYHLGGFGFSFEESVMRALGESVERAAHFMFHVQKAELISRHSEKELRLRGERYLPLAEFGQFTAEQLEGPRCMVQSVDENTVLSWVPAVDLRDGGDTMLPAQAVLAGFSEEPRAFVGITTGTATHLDYDRALVNALVEMLQVDATVGHWYSTSTAPKIEVSRESTPRFLQFSERQAQWLQRDCARYEFYWLRQPEDLPCYVIACAVRGTESFPALCIGLGAATDLEEAMYRALYEAIPVSIVAMIQALMQLFEDPGSDQLPPRRRTADLKSLFARLDTSQVMDLEAAVAYYAMPEYADRVFPSHFDPRQTIGVPEIYGMVPPVWRSEPAEHLRSLMLAEVARRYRVFAMDLTMADIARLGLRVARLYSPDLMCLCLPSLPEAAHPRFRAYGGFRSAEPHPYP